MFIFLCEATFDNTLTHSTRTQKNPKKNLHFDDCHFK